MIHFSFVGPQQQLHELIGLHKSLLKWIYFLFEETLGKRNL